MAKEALGSHSPHQVWQKPLTWCQLEKSQVDVAFLTVWPRGHFFVKEIWALQGQPTRASGMNQTLLTYLGWGDHVLAAHPYPHRATPKLGAGPSAPYKRQGAPTPTSVSLSNLRSLGFLKPDCLVGADD